jgi:hypothetical protein
MDIKQCKEQKRVWRMVGRGRHKTRLVSAATSHHHHRHPPTTTTTKTTKTTKTAAILIRYIV